MHYLVDSNTKVIFGWSAKCGCAHLKKIFMFFHDDDSECVHKPIYRQTQLPKDIQNYTVIIVGRNPYKRLVSGFLEKYTNTKTNNFHKMWKKDRSTLTFSNFVNQLVKNNWETVERHHFTPQTTELFDESILIKSKKMVVYDLGNIDYTFIESLYNRKIPEGLIKFKGSHRNKSSIPLDKPVFDLCLDEYFDFKVPLDCFYNERLTQLVYNYYKNDFIFLKRNGLDYTNTFNGEGGVKLLS